MAVAPDSLATNFLTELIIVFAPCCEMRTPAEQTAPLRNAENLRAPRFEWVNSIFDSRPFARLLFPWLNGI